MYNFYREDWLVDRLARTVGEAFGHTPCVDVLRGRQAVITAGLTADDQRCAPGSARPGRARRPPPTTTRSSTCSDRRSRRSTW